MSVGYAVVDVETTGLFAGRWHNRIAEVAVVHVGRDGNVTGEWSTLVNPERDLGPQHIHGIRAGDVLTAPRFADIAGDLAPLLAGRVVVAHNLGFDLRFLRYEFERLGFSVPLDVEFGLCTMAMSERYLAGSSRSLSACCAAAGVRQGTAHSALHDARAAAGLLGCFVRVAGQPEPWDALFGGGLLWPGIPPGCGRTRRRGTIDAQPTSFLSRLVDRLPRIPDMPHADEYLAVLDQALLDRHLSISEQDALLELAESLKLSFDAAMALHRRYLVALAQVAWADGLVTDGERLDLVRVAELLGLSADDVTVALDAGRNHQEAPRLGQFRLRRGDTVAFTGQLSGSREEWERQALAIGLVVTPGGVTRRTRLLVAADPDSLSGKADKARRYGIPIVTEEAFAGLLERMDD
ncbi:exonuclease domain-containing protein [Actinophytocola oryzae]|uniref:DNA polymerase-3 subunit epsilon n=1 Tax=Actinophytocola oryzae TaxID=502181 RepID=A0A4R7VP52_9PSEU|nr:exonuclease domain-containing protein [Actinophytocola oryzae]TDV51049.1 DNA polymerase-3 subunit epsilon [Actinophytocola oryzae]